MRLEINSLDQLVNVFEELLKEVEAPKEEIKKEVKKEAAKAELAKEEVKEPIKDESLAEEGEALCNCVYAFNNNCFELAHHVGEYIVDSATYLEFEHEEDGVVVPGLTEKQLLRVLLYRNRNNKERSKLIEKLFNE